MKTFLTTCSLTIFILFSNLISAQNDYVSTWKFEVNISHEMGYRYLTQDKDSESYVQNIINFRKEIEKPSTGIITIME